MGFRKSRGNLESVPPLCELPSRMSQSRLRHFTTRTRLWHQSRTCRPSGGDDTIACGATLNDLPRPHCLRRDAFSRDALRVCVGNGRNRFQRHPTPDVGWSPAGGRKQCGGRTAVTCRLTCQRPTGSLGQHKQAALMRPFLGVEPETELLGADRQAWFALCYLA
jgi:hypothetical protein